MTVETREAGIALRTSTNAPDAAVAWTVKCLNCGAALAGPFCAECGQRALPPDPTVRELVGEAVAELSGWDGKLAETIRLLVRKPGELTRQWLDGRRVQFISPLRLYLTASLLFFLIAGAAPDLAVRPGEMRAGALTIGVSRSGPQKVGDQATAAVQSKQALTGPTRDSALAGIAKAPKLLRPMLRRAVTEPTAFSDAIRAAMPRVFFGLVPVFGGILALFYRRRNFPEHLYFAIHLHAFFFVARGIGDLAKFTHSVALTMVTQVVTSLWIAAYGYIALRRVYGGSALGTVGKGIGICILYGLIAAPVILTMAIIVAS